MFPERASRGHGRAVPVDVVERCVVWVRVEEETGVVSCLLAKARGDWSEERIARELPVHHVRPSGTASYTTSLRMIDRAPGPSQRCTS